MPHCRQASDLSVGDVFFVSPHGEFDPDRVLVCRVLEDGAARLRARVLNGRWTATLCRHGTAGVSLEAQGGRETPMLPGWMVSHVIEMDEGTTRLADRGDHEGLVDLALTEIGLPGLLAAA